MTRNKFWHNLWVRYRLSKADYEQLLERTNKQCEICKSSRSLCIDHCHDSGLVRGLLCKSCNQSLGQFGDSVDGLKKAIQYLRAHANRISRRRAGKRADGLPNVRTIIVTRTRHSLGGNVRLSAAAGGPRDRSSGNAGSVQPRVAVRDAAGSCPENPARSAVRRHKRIGQVLHERFGRQAWSLRPGRLDRQCRRYPQGGEGAQPDRTRNRRASRHPGPSTPQEAALRATDPRGDEKRAGEKSGQKMEKRRIA